jgi:hypothetical protein
MYALWSIPRHKKSVHCLEQVNLKSTRLKNGHKRDEERMGAIKRRRELPLHPFSPFLFPPDLLGSSPAKKLASTPWTFFLIRHL